jgi:hypothetical protein
MLRIVFCFLLVAGNAYAGAPGVLGLFNDEYGTDCNLHDVAPQIMTIYVVHNHTTGAQAARFKATLPACMIGAVYLTEATMWPIKIGIAPTGTLVGYGGCETGHVLVMTISVFGNGLSSDCCVFALQPAPDAVTGEVEVENCSGLWEWIPSVPAYVNPIRKALQPPGCRAFSFFYGGPDETYLELL